jgi:hypothetical protein
MGRSFRVGLWKAKGKERFSPCSGLESIRPSFPRSLLCSLPAADVRGIARWQVAPALKERHAILCESVLCPESPGHVSFMPTSYVRMNRLGTNRCRRDAAVLDESQSLMSAERSRQLGSC